MQRNPTLSAGMSQPAVLLATALLLSASAPAQFPSTKTQHWVVDAADSEGRSFLSLAPAIAKAAPGDIIHVRTGVYDEGFETNKGVHIQGEPGVRIRGIGELGGIRVAGVPADQMFSMRDVILDAPASLTIDTCDGRVLLERVIADTGSFLGSRQVDLQSCEFIVRAASCHLSMNRLWVVPTRLLDGAATVQLIDSVTTMSNCKVDGVEAPGVQVVNGRLFLSGDVPGTGITAGDRGDLPTPAVYASGSARIWRNLSHPLEPSRGAPAIEGGEPQVVTMPILEGQPLEIGSLIQTDLSGPYSAPYLMLLGSPTAPVEVPGALGELWIGSPAVLSGGVFPKNGFQIDYLAMPLEPALVGLQVTRQLVSLDPELGLVLSNADTSVIYEQPELHQKR